MSSMDPPQENGPDGSSIKPVSSLRARFENMNKTLDATPSLLPSQPPSRPISPRPKPERLQNFKSSHDVTPHSTTPTTPMKPGKPLEGFATPAAPVDHDHEPPISRPPSTRPPAINTRPYEKSHEPPTLPPSVKILPPQSPPKGKAPGHAAGDQSPFLDPDSAAAAGTPKPLKLGPGRPLSPTPIVPPPRSPRPGSSLPPSPPPPRRSAEMRRDRDVKPAPQPPPPRVEPRQPSSGLQPSSSLPEPRGHPFLRRGDISDEASPFSSPPSSPGSSSEEAPPQLPGRPRPKPQESTAGKAPAILGGFEPPPVHHAVADRRRERDHGANGSAKAPITMDVNGKERPILPTRPQVRDPYQQQSVVHPIKAPARPPRVITSNDGQNSEGMSSSAPAHRAVSTPQSHQLPPRAIGRHERSQTVDKTSERAPPETRNAPAHLPAVTKSIQPSIAADLAMPSVEPATHVSTYPDGAYTNRKPPYVKTGSYQIQTKYDPRIFDVCGDLVCTSGHLTRVWDLADGEQVLSLSHTEGIKATAVTFKPAANPDEEGTKLWIGTNGGDIMEVEIATHRITCSKPGTHSRCEIIKIHRHYSELWTLDEGGTLLVWGPGANDGAPDLAGYSSQNYKVPKGHTFSMVIGDELWHATGKTLRVFAPTTDGRRPFQVLIRPLSIDGAGDVTSGTLVRTQPGKAFFGHVDGKISVYSTADYSCQAIVNVSTWKINALASAGRHLWVGYNTGKMCVYDIDQTPWVTIKEWQGHDNPVVKMKMDHSSSYRVGRSQLLSLGTDNKVKIWDGHLQDDWIEDEMKAKDSTYCTFSEVTASVMTWNAGAATPHSLRYSDGDAKFIQGLLQASGSPDILIFAFQELVDLEDKTATAKRLLKSKKKDGSDHERMSHRYRDWRDFLLKSLDDFFPADDLYHLLHTAPLVGLFTCVFVKASLHGRIRNLSGAEVKRGMGGLHGNKGAVAVRFQIDDSSLCFVNCHLAAGQSQTNSRHNDIAAILETNLFPTERDPGMRMDSYMGGGDGSMILDHELCIINGDLNYRIDTMSRDTVVKAVKQDNLSKLLDRDQLLVSRRRNPVFRLRAFEEMPITFAPTYKYDVGTDNYDTSEKRRSPAWCDRMLYRGKGRMQQLDYQRHEVRVSDHRPVTGNFRLWVKKVDVRTRAIAWTNSQKGFEEVRQQQVAAEELSYLVDTCELDEATGRQLIKKKEARLTSRSSSRNRDTRR